MRDLMHSIISVNDNIVLQLYNVININTWANILQYIHIHLWFIQCYMSKLFTKNWEMIHISFKQKKLRLQGCVAYSKIEELWWALGEEHCGWTEANQKKGLEGDFVLWGSRETQWEGGGDWSEIPKESESNLPRELRELVCKWCREHNRGNDLGQEQ